MNACGLANRLWRAAGRGRWRRFAAALDRPERTQRAILRRYLAHNAGTRFGRDHGFDAIRTLAEYRRRVPVRTYDELASYVDAIRAGEPRVLTAGKVTRLVPSSGSAAARKLVPYGAELLAEFGRGIAPWIVDLYRRRPELMAGRAYWSISPPAADRFADEGAKVPIGFDRDSAYLGGFWQKLVDRTLALPPAARDERDPERFFRATLVHLLRARDLRLVSVWHPSFLTLLLEPLAKDWDALIAAAGREDLRGVSPERLRAIWPELGLVSAWGDAGAAGAFAELRRLFPDAEVERKGLVATEAFVTLPFAGARPLAVRSHFFEFLDDGGEAHLASELERGGEYALVVTTGGGLYRYRLGDRVRVEGFLGATPSLRFFGREDRVSDLRGEKLNEHHVARALGELGLGDGFAMLAPDERPGYTLYVERPATPATSERSPRAGEPAALHLQRGPSPDLAARLDERLLENPHYRVCRDAGQLRPVRVFAIAGGAHHAYLRRHEREGRQRGEIKPAALARAGGWDEVFDGGYLETETPARVAAGKSPLAPLFQRGEPETRSESPGPDYRNAIPR